VQDDYDNIFSKIALGMTSAQLAKDLFVEDEGVGEDLTFNFMGWVHEDLVIVCQLKKELMNLEPSERMTRCGRMCLALRKYWGVTDITMIAEGFCSKDPQRTKSLDLAKSYAEKDPEVTECITVTHASISENEEIGVDLVAVPYAYEPGRSVSWGEVMTFPGGADKVLRNASFPKMLKVALKEKVIEEEIVDETYDELRMLINDNGFYIQEFF